MLVISFNTLFLRYEVKAKVRNAIGQHIMSMYICIYCITPIYYIFSAFTWGFMIEEIFQQEITKIAVID